MIRTVLLSTLILTLIGLLPACDREGASSAQTPAEHPPDRGHPRLVVLSPALAVIIHDLGRDDLIVGRHGFDETSDREIRVVGDQSGIDYEALLSSRPTHVLLERSSQGVPRRLAELGTSNGWYITSFPLLTLSDIRAAVRGLDDLTRASDAEEQSPNCQSLLDEMDRAWAIRNGIAAHAGRTLILAWTDPIGAMGPGSFHHQLVLALGGDPVPDQGNPFITMSVEDVIHLDPDSLILLLPGSKEQDLSRLLGPLSRADLRAVKSGRVGVITDRLAHSPSTAMISVADDLAEVMLAWPLLEE